MKLSNVFFLFLFALLTLPAWAVNSELQDASTSIFHTNIVKDVNDTEAKCMKPVKIKGKISYVPDTKSAVQNKKGQVLARLCTHEFEKCKVEGSCLVESDTGKKLINITGRGASTFDEVDQNKCKFGTGSIINKSRSCLIPYKTLACAPQVPVGTVIYIQEAADKSYSVDGGPIQKHDGNFICGDTGSDIVGGDCRVDVFTGYRAKDQPYNELDLVLRDKTVTNHCAKIQGGKLASDDKLIKDLTNLLLTSGASPSPGAVADNSRSRSPASSGGVGTR